MFGESLMDMVDPCCFASLGPGRLIIAYRHRNSLDTLEADTLPNHSV